ncbi:MAG TPA: hypothetical protein VGN57_12795 [Pirellulaceae bacterium]|jgi:hypothetical protein|nr:hypothetical protein [Pirellulaceae bacterium]
MTAPHVIVVTIDGLGVAAAGAYGQTSLPTPGWDALATSAVTFDFVDAPGASREAILAAFARTATPSVVDALKGLAESGALVRLAGDLEDFAKPGAGVFAACFGDRSSFDLEPPTTPAEGEDEALSLRWLAKAEREILALATAPPERSHVLWLHHAGAYGPWDAPLEWREALRDEEDPPAYAEVAPPQDAAPADRDPDRFLPFTFAWAGQAAAWDRLAEGLHLLWKRLDAKRPTTLIVLGLRGFPLGEHGIVGDGAGEAVGPPLHGERLHVPFFVLPPGGTFPGKRALGVRRSDALLAKLLNAAETSGDESAFGTLLEAETSSEPDLSACAVVEEGASLSVRTALWRYLREGERHRLYLKPDDKWEANDVASRRRDTVEAFERWLEERTRDQTLPLPDEATTM